MFVAMARNRPARHNKRMLRPVRLVLVALISVLLAGCATSEVKQTNAVGLVSGTPNGTIQSGYGDGKGDSVGGGGAAPATDWKGETGSGEGK